MLPCLCCPLVSCHPRSERDRDSVARIILFLCLCLCLCFFYLCLCPSLARAPSPSSLPPSPPPLTQATNTCKPSHMHASHLLVVVVVLLLLSCCCLLYHGRFCEDVSDRHRKMPPRDVVENQERQKRYYGPSVHPHKLHAQARIGVVSKREVVKT